MVFYAVRELDFYWEMPWRPVSILAFFQETLSHTKLVNMTISPG